MIYSQRCSYTGRKPPHYIGINIYLKAHVTRRCQMLFFLLISQPLQYLSCRSGRRGGGKEINLFQSQRYPPSYFITLFVKTKPLFLREDKGENDLVIQYKYILRILFKNSLSQARTHISSVLFTLQNYIQFFNPIT